MRKEEMTTNNPEQLKFTFYRPSFEYIIIIEPLGLLYGSAGKFLSPENLVGRSGTSFPPSSAALSGLFAAEYKGDNNYLEHLQLAGPFWAWSEKPQNFYVPTPFNCLINSYTTKFHPYYQYDKYKYKKLAKIGKITQQLAWHRNQEQNQNGEISGSWLPSTSGKFDKGSWVAIEDWKFIQFDLPSTHMQVKVEFSPWEYAPHLHPRLEEDERRVSKDLERGSLFLENAVQLNPNACLVYLSNTKLTNGWYRFGGEGHMVDVSCIELSQDTQNLLKQPVGNSFALITPAVWGSNRLSERKPVYLNKENDLGNDEKKPWSVAALMTERPVPFRYRLGNHQTNNSQTISNEREKSKNSPKLLSRGRYAVPAGSVYIVKEFIEKSWQAWDDSWFPKEGPSLKRWGCGLALPLPSALGCNLL